MITLPQLGQPLNDDQVKLLEAFARSCRRSIIDMLKTSQSGHPGGSLSTIDYLSTLYAYIISQTGEPVVVSNGHISPAVYSVLAELGYVDKQLVIDTFRQDGSIFEGHVSRHVPGVVYGTGPLGIGASVAAGIALGNRLDQVDERVFALMGDGEFQEGQIAEMMHFAKHHKLHRLILFVDYNKVQLSDSLSTMMDTDLKPEFEACGWKVLEVDGHDYRAIWSVLELADKTAGQPVVILGHTIMGKGVSYMEETGLRHEATWHGNAPKPELADAALAELKLTDEQVALLDNFRTNHVAWTPDEPTDTPALTRRPEVNMGEPRILESGTKSDCRSAYGKALVDLAEINPQVVAMTADLRGSVKTDGVLKAFPERHIECGIAEQLMVSAAGGLSLTGKIPFASTFGAFMSSRAKDQARVNDINRTNVKMVATHCGLSVGEDGPTHQAIDDMGSFLGLLNTHVIEPADANQTDHIIRYIASHEGQFYVRMGRHKFEVLTKLDGSPFYDANYEYYYGRTDVIRPGDKITLAASGALVREALDLWDELETKGVSVELVAVSSIKHFDETVFDSLRKTQRLITLEDHNPYSGLSSQLIREATLQGIRLEGIRSLGVTEYQLSGQPAELYARAGLGPDDILQAIEELLG